MLPAYDSTRPKGAGAGGGGLISRPLDTGRKFRVKLAKVGN